MYTLYIVESLSMRKYSDEDEPWIRKFVQHGGLRHLFDIFMSGKEITVINIDLSIFSC